MWIFISFNNVNERLFNIRFTIAFSTTLENNSIRLINFLYKLDSI